MTETTLEVTDLFGVLDFAGVQKRLLALPRGGIGRDDAGLGQRDGTEAAIPIPDVVSGHIVVLRARNKLPADGEVTGGTSTIDQPMLTGGSMPVTKTVGDTVIGATVNNSGTLNCRSTKVGACAALAQISKPVQEAQNSKVPSQLLADKAAQWLVLAAIVIGPGTLAVWFWVLGEPLQLP